MTGIDGVLQALRLEVFPMDTRGVDYAVGDMRIGDIFVRDVTEHFARHQFDSPEQVIEEIRRVLAQRSQAA